MLYNITIKDDLRHFVLVTKIKLKLLKLVNRSIEFGTFEKRLEGMKD